MKSTGFFTTFEPDPVGVLLGTGYQRFETADGMAGLAKVTGDRLDVLAVVAARAGEGKFRRFIAAAKRAFAVVAVWEDWNPIIGGALQRYGFQPATQTEADGEVIHGWQWVIQSAAPLHHPRPDAARPGDYPDNWKDIASRIKTSAGWRCERCRHPHEVETGYVLTVHHLDGNKSNCADWNLAALCQRCHLHIQGKVKMDQMFFAEILDVSEWFKPHLEGFLRAKSPNDADQPRLADRDNPMKP